jgi:hypothetical protein
VGLSRRHGEKYAGQHAQGQNQEPASTDRLPTDQNILRPGPAPPTICRCRGQVNPHIPSNRRSPSEPKRPPRPSSRSSREVPSTRSRPLRPLGETGPNGDPRGLSHAL